MAASTTAIWKDFNQELRRFIQKRVKDDALADDLLQDIFIKIHLKLDTLTASDKLSAWVYQITRNTILDHYKKNKPNAEIPSDLLVGEETKTYNEEFSSCLTPFLNSLPESYRDAIVQTELGHLSQKEFAEKLDISYSGAKSRVQRGRKHLLELFHQCCQISTDRYGNILAYQDKENCTKC